jgi:hypothetical protein
MRSLALLVLLLSCPALAAAQDTESKPPPATEPAAIDATKLGVSLDRIQKQLRVVESQEKQPGALRLSFQVQVFGQAPRIDLLRGVDILHGDAPNSAPTHRQIIEFNTPQIYRTQGAPLSAIVGWAAMKIYESSKKSKCEAEIASYRELLMQGVNVAAPRCTQ